VQECWEANGSLWTAAKHVPATFDGLLRLRQIPELQYIK
jgi:hypothetical protein